MPTEIKKVQPGPGVMGSKAFKTVAGFFTGGPIGAFAGLAGDSPAGKAMGMFGGMGGKGGDKPPAPGVEQGAPQMAGGPGDNVGSVGDDSLSRRYQALSVENPQAHIESGLAYLKDPSTPQYLRDAYAEPLLRAKYYKQPGSIG